MFTKEEFYVFLDGFSEDKRDKLAEAYKRSFHKQMGECEAALVDKDALRLQYAVHNLKTLGYMIQARELGDIAEEAEADIIKGDDASAFEKIPRISSLVHKILDIIQV